MTRESDARPSREEIRGELDAEPRLSWLLRRKVTVPERTAGYMDRAGLVERTMPTRSRLTVLLARGGFGKTTVLAECCRYLSERGIVTAWVSVDASDDADVLDSYIAFAFQYAGLSIEGASERDGATESRTGLLARVLEARREPFVLALDDLHRLTDPAAVALLDFLIRRAPPSTCWTQRSSMRVPACGSRGAGRWCFPDAWRKPASSMARWPPRRSPRPGRTTRRPSSAGWTTSSCEGSSSSTEAGLSARSNPRRPMKIF